MSHYLSCLMGASKIEDQELEKRGVEIVERTKIGSRRLIIPHTALGEYEQLVIEKLDPGFWNDIISQDEIIFIFKLKDGSIKRFIFAKDNEKEIAELCSKLNGDPFEKTSNILNYLIVSPFYEDTIRNYHYAHLPKKCMSSGALFFDEKGNILIVKPTYKPGWEIPGGVIENEDSPMQTVVREVEEEMGLQLKDPALLCVQYVANVDGRGDRVAFIFNGGILKDADIKTIKLQVNELSEFMCISEDQIHDFFGGKPQFETRILRAILARKEGTTAYIESVSV